MNAVSPRDGDLGPTLGRDGEPIARAVLPVHPAPVDVGTGAVESLTGYVQRVAAANALSVATVLALIGWVPPRGRARDSYVRLPRTWDLLPDDLSRLAALTGQPASVLTQLTALPLFHTVCGAATPPTAVAIHHFFHPRGSLRTVALHRRFCPRCLQEALVYRLLWQFREIEVCLRHGDRLVGACPRGHEPIPVLSKGSALGRCGRCLAPFTDTPARDASGPLLRSQAAIHADYAALVSGAIRLALPDRGLAEWAAIRLRLEFLRAQQRLTHQAVARATRLHRKSPLWQRADAGAVSLGSLLRAVRFHTASLRDFARVTPPPEWDVPTPPAVRRPCLNPWCADYRSSAITWTSGSVYYCRSCGGAGSLRQTHRYGVPVARFWHVLFDAYHGTQAGQSVEQALAAAGLPARHRRRLVHRLIRCGLAEQQGETCVLTPVPQASMHGYPLTPPLALQLRRGQSQERQAELAKRVEHGLVTLERTGRALTIANLARLWHVSYPVLYRQIRRSVPGCLHRIESIRQRVAPARA